MKKITILILVLATSFGFAQNFQGMAVYESKTSTSDFTNRMKDNKNITPEMLKNIEERMKKMMEKTYILNFDKNSSVYKEEEKLDAMEQSGGRGRMMMFGLGGGTMYKNVKEKLFLNDKEFYGKEFLIKDSLPTYEWQLSGETKQIGNYTCYKATAVVPVSKSDFRNMRLRDEKKDSETTKDSTKVKEKKTNFMDAIEIPKEVTITAWYAPEIPVNQGPEKYWGLPGLILEVSDGKTITLCSKIVMNPKEKVEIKAPNKGKEVTQTEYDDIILKKMEEMREMYGGQRGGSGFRMR